MTSQDSLFGDEPEHDSGPTESPAATGIAPWQVDQVRAAFNRRGVLDMQARRHFIEEIAGRPVDNLRELTFMEALRVLEGLSDTSPTRKTSSWDDRDEDTWIDRL